LKYFSDGRRRYVNNYSSGGTSTWLAITEHDANGTQSSIQFDLQITNSNPYIDYANFSTSGADAWIQEFRIICQGIPIEEISDYNTTFEKWMDIGGFCQEEFKMYLNNYGVHPPFILAQKPILSNRP
jgi:hypothetical protein